jgi:hypothetical protein
MLTKDIHMTKHFQDFLVDSPSVELRIKMELPFSPHSRQELVASISIHI